MRQAESHAITPILIAFLLMGFATLEGQADAQLPIEVMLRVDKTEYLLDEPIWVDVIVTNASDKAELLPSPRRSRNLYELSLTDSKGDSVPQTPAIVVGCHWATNDPDTLVPPGDTLYFLRNLLETYGENELPGLSVVNRLPTGSYSLRAKFSGERLSNEVFFSVVHPTGEELPAHSLLIAGLEREWKEPRNADVPEFLAILEDHPKSCYAPLACVHLASTYRFKQHNRHEVDSIYLKLLREYANSGYVNSALWTYIEQHGESARPLIDSLKTASNSLRFRMLARKYGF